MAAEAKIAWWRAAAAAVAALIAVVALMIATNQLLVADLRVLAVGTAAFAAVTLPLAALWHGLGGYLCAALARDSPLAAVEVVILGFAMMAGSVVNTWTIVPPWYSLAMLVLAPVCLWLGTRAHLRRRAAARPAAA